MKRAKFNKLLTPKFNCELELHNQDTGINGHASVSKEELGSIAHLLDNSIE